VKGKTMKISVLIFGVLIILTISFIQPCASTRYNTGDTQMEKLKKSAQYRDNKFVNYKPAQQWGISDIVPMAWDFFVTGNDRTPDVDLPVKRVDFGKIKNSKPDELKVTWVGHSSLIINLDGLLILTDPVFENRTTMMGPSRYSGDVPLDIEEIPNIDLVLISHNHYDHLDAYTIERIYPNVKQFVTPLMVGAELEDIGVPREKIIELDWWDEITLFENLLVVLTPAQHFSGRGMFDRDETLWGSFVLAGPKRKIYYSGDSGYFEGFKDIGEKYGPFDITMMECGAYNKRWHFVHMMPEETAQAHLDLKGKILQPIHWGTFNLALHSWHDPIVRVSKAADSLGIKLLTPIVGETLTIDKNLRTERWWVSILNHEQLSRKQ
jgi:L-ascorbate metabolism protein UlaG (beta-lactamase superfamily)